MGKPEETADELGAKSRADEEAIKEEICTVEISTRVWSSSKDGEGVLWNQA